MLRSSRYDIARSVGEGNINFIVRTRTQGQSVYPDIALHISNYCVYCIEDQNLTHAIAEHYCQTRAYLPYILMLIFPMKTFCNMNCRKVQFIEVKTYYLGQKLFLRF